VTDPVPVAFDLRGLVPAVVQEATTGEVLMLAWMNREALDRTLRTGRAHFWSRSRQVLWEKGATSGHRQHVEAVYADCDRDALVLRVHQEGVACHTGSRTCFFTRLDAAAARPAPDGESAGEASPGVPDPTGILDTLERLIQARRVAPPEGSYVGQLLAGPDARLLKKVGEEAAEVVVAAVQESPERLVSEVADLWFHTLVLLGGRGLSARQVFRELARRHAARHPASPPPPGAGA
jgi:phosphoribosyl-ATP pyrophosphohydrolase/phosphoribosyl-AMP cyclohydrolase